MMRLSVKFGQMKKYLSVDEEKRKKEEDVKDDDDDEKNFDTQLCVQNCCYRCIDYHQFKFTGGWS